MSNCEREIADALKQLGLSTSQFSKSEPTATSDILRTAKRRFVTGNPRVWWLGFRPPYETHPYGAPDDWAERLNAIIPHGTTRCWLIVESEGDAHPVYDVDVATVVPVLKECSFFEYYLVSPDFSWLIADTDHNQFLVAHAADEQAGKN